VAQLQADLDTALLGPRTDQVIAAEAEVRRARRRWLGLNELGQKRQQPKSGLVFDTLYREGEWVPAGLVVVLPPENIKVRAFVQEKRLGTIHPGDDARVAVDGVARPFSGKVSTSRRAPIHAPGDL
jgi:HlyD family secretion protein